MRRPTGGHPVTVSGRPLVVDLYARLSRCPEDGNLEVVDTQLADCRKVAQRNGWVIGQEHRDNSLSAWKRGVRRPGWEAMLARIEAGATEGVLVWHTDRLLRQPRDLERLIDLGDKRGLVLASAYGEHDIANSDHRLAMRIHAAVACKASDDTSRRIKRRFEAMREAGMGTGGARAFGFAGKDRTTGHPVPAAAVERERAVLRRAAEDLLAGMPLIRIASAWNSAGVLTATGAEWRPVQVRQVLARAINAGLIEHDGKVVGRLPGEPIIDEETWQRLRAVFAARRRGRVPGQTYLASGIVLCGLCGKAVTGRPHVGTYSADGHRRRQYHCPTGRGGCGRVAADARRVDEALRALVVGRLGDPGQVQRLAAEDAETARRLGDLAEEIAQAQTLRESLGDRLGRGEINLAVFDAAMRPLTNRLARLEAEREALTTVEPPGELPDPDAGRAELARQWDDHDVASRRQLLLMALRGYRVRLLSAQGRRVWSVDRLEVEQIGK